MYEKCVGRRILPNIETTHFVRYILIGEYALFIYYEKYIVLRKIQAPFSNT